MGTALQNALSRLWSKEQPTLLQCGKKIALKLQHRYSLTLPNEFAEYVETALPLSTWWGPHGFQYWDRNSLPNLQDEQDITPAHHRYPAIWSEDKHYIIFTDYLDRCYDYAICCSGGSNHGKVALVGNCTNRLVANSLSEFINLAAENSDRIHSPVGDHYGNVA